jgi:spore coat protein H
MGVGKRHGAGPRWLLLVLCAVLPACPAPSGWSVEPPDCEGPDGASFLEAISKGRMAAGAVDPWSYEEEDGLPVFHLFMASSLPDDDGYRPARLIYRGRCMLAETRYRGDTSLRFPKRSLTLDFEDGYTFDEPAGGFLGRRKLVLISPFNDNSYLRARLAFEVWNRMSPGHVRMKAYSAVVYVNGEYHGLFTVTDHLNRHFLADRGLDPDGELFKAVEADANFSRLDTRGAQKVDLHLGFEKKNGEPEDGDAAFRTLNALTAFVADATPEQFAAERGAWMDTRDYEDWWLFSWFVYAKDSVAKNAYHYRARGPGARFRYIPWDLDASFGQDWNTQRLDANDLYDFTPENRLFARLREDAAIASAMDARARELLAGPLHRDVVLGLVDAYASEVRAAALKDQARWSAEHRDFIRWRGRPDFNDFEGEVAYVRAWVDTRWRALEAPPR